MFVIAIILFVGGMVAMGISFSLPILEGLVFVGGRLGAREPSRLSRPPHRRA